MRKIFQSVIAGMLAGTAALTAASGTFCASGAPDESDLYCHDTFESGTDGWEGRGGASVATAGNAYAGSKALTVTGRKSEWHGAMKALDPDIYKAGETYSFSVAAAGSGKMMLSLQYTDASGKTVYDHLADGNSYGDYIQLADPNYTLPSGTDHILYVETESGTGDFSIDEAIIAKAGTEIDGPKPVVITPGDVNCDGYIDVFDMPMLRKGLTDGLSGAASKAADVNGDRKYTVADTVQIAEFILGQRSEFEKDTTLPPEDYMDRIRSMVTATVPSSALAKAEGGVEHITYFSKKANRNKGANVWLPPGYDPNEQYPVLYVNHGYGGDEGSMVNGMGVREIATNLIKSGEAVPMIIVFTNQYTDPQHEKQTGNGQADVPGYDNFVEDLPDSLMPYIESHYPVKTGRENTAVAGFSMGGRESLYIGIKCCDKVGYIGGGAPAPGIFPTRDQFMNHPGVMSKDDMRIDPPYSPYILMIAGGTNDGMANDYPKQYSDLFTQHGTDNIYISVPGGGHDSSTVIPLMYNFIRFIFRTDI